MAFLALITGLGLDRRFSLDPEEVVIGRSKELLVTLEGINVSRRHARVFRKGNEYWAEDLKSANGTYVNDKRIGAAVLLAPNDLLRIGPYTLRFESGSSHATDFTIQRETAALAGNNELYRENPALKLQAVLELAHELAHSLDVETLLNRFLDQLFKLFPHAERALIVFFEQEEPLVRLVRDRRAFPGKEQLFSRTVLKQVREKGIAVLAEDAQNFQANMTLHAMGVRSLLCVPLRSHGTSVFGAVQMDRFQSGSPFTSEDLHLLTAVTLLVSLVLEKARLHQQLIAQERIGRELALAREIQRAFLPREVPVVHPGPLDLCAELHPAEEVSGDFYDFIAVDKGRVALVVADVSGKGMPAALFMSMVRALLRQSIKPGRGPAEILAELNGALARDNPKFMFVTVLLGIYEPATGLCSFARGGHMAPLLRRSDGTVEEVESHPGCLIGIEEGGVALCEQSVALAEGDTLIFYTDGITEAAKLEGGEMFGGPRLLKAAAAFPSGGQLKDWAAALRAEVNGFCAPGGPQDDITLLLLRHAPTPPPASV